MKKVFITLGIILVALSIMAPDNSKAEKLKVDNTGWEANPIVMSVPLSCKFGIATAGEHAEFYVEVGDVTVWNQSGSLYVEARGTKRDIVKMDDNHWDYVKIMPATLDVVSWNGDDDGTGIFTSVTLTLIGPSGNLIGTTIVENQVITGNFDCGVGCPES